MNYIWLALGSYLCFAVAGIGDKLILSRTVRQPLAYAFYIGIISPMFLLLLPFGFHFLSPVQTLSALLGGAAFVYALIFLYRGTSITSPARITTLIGGFEPVFVFVLAFFIAGEHLTSLQFLAFLLMVSGSVLITLHRSEGRWSAKALGNALIASLLFALAYAFFKYTYNHTNFVSGLIWTRLGLFLGAASFLAIKSFRQTIISDWRITKPISGWLVFFGNVVIGGWLGTILQNYALARGSVSIVAALGGVQFVFLLLFSFIITKYFSRILDEDIGWRSLAQKIIAIFLISCGLILLNIKPAVAQPAWGIEFSPQNALQLGLDPNEVLANIRSDLKPSVIRFVNEDPQPVDLEPVRFSRVLGFYRLPLPAQILRLLHPKATAARVQAQPPRFDLSPEAQKMLMNQKVLQNNLKYAEQAGFATNYLQGAEWWYYLAVKEGDYGMWAAAKDLFAQ